MTMAQMKPINCSCGAVLFKTIESFMVKDSFTIIKCGKCGTLQKVSVEVISQIKVEPVKVD